MNYIYDIYLNFNNNLIDFFEWNKNDKLIHLKKVPIIKISKTTFKIICSNSIRLDCSTLSEIEYKTEQWKNKRNIKYCALFCTDSSILCIKFNNNGESIKKSFLFIDEELEILDSIHNLKEKILKFKILKKEKSTLKTREQLKKDIFIKNKLSKVSNDELKYIYYECFNKKNNKDKMNLDIERIDKNSIQYEKLYNILKLITSIKK